jgi:DNA-binding transcriptional LysR family regulator
MPKIADWDDQIGRRLRLRDLRVLFAVVQSGSLAKAAVELRVSQPAVSQVVSNLERALGVRLVDRNSRGVEPTLYARALLARGRAAFDELRQGIRDIEFLANPTAGELTLGYPESLTATVLPKMVERFSEKYPRVVLRGDIVAAPSYKFAGLRERTHDLILTPMPPDDYPVDDLNVEVLFDDPWVVVAGKHTAWARRRNIDLGELIDEPWLLPPADAESYAQVAEAFTARGLGLPRAGMVTYSLHLRAKLASRGRFITIVPKSMLQHDSEGRRLKMLSVDVPTWSFLVTIMTLKNRTLSPVVERFIECAREVTRQMQEGRTASKR